MAADPKTTDLRSKLADTIGPMLVPARGLSAGLVGRAYRKKAEAIADAVIARIHGEGLSVHSQHEDVSRG